MYEKIPISIEDQELIIHTEEPKKISLSKILLYKNFDFDQYYIKQVHKTSMDFPTERIRDTGFRTAETAGAPGGTARRNG